jgi:intracellular multiplication protein IcmO
VPLDKQKGDEPSKQHGYAQFYFTATFTQLAVSLGHIFRVENGDIDMRDVVLNRRILVVNLPALENSDATLAALGKLVVASLRGMMAQLLGASLEGDYTDADKPGMGPSPYPVVLDELAYYATSGLDRMLAMGRGLNIAFILGFQEVSGIWARLGEKTASLLGNANLTIAMRQQDSGRTREWIERTAGQTYIAQAISYHGVADGAYREARHAELRPVSRIDWNDLTNLIEGEAIVLFAGRRIYARVFHAKIDDRGPKRLGRTVMLRRPNPDEVRHRFERIGKIVAAMESGKVGRGPPEEVSPALATLLRGFAQTACRGGDAAARAARALQEIGLVPGEPPARCPPAVADGVPITDVTAMLAAASKATLTPDADTAAEPGGPINAGLLRGLAAIETAAGTAAADARRRALAILAERDATLSAPVAVEPPPITPETFRMHLAAVARQLEALREFADGRRIA